MNRLLALVLLWSAPLLAAEVTGTWKGTLVVNLPSGETREATACLKLKQEGSNISGSVGPDEERQRSLTSGQIDGNRVSLEDGHHILTLSVSGDRMKGEMRNAKQPDGPVSQLDLRRKKP